MSQLERQWPWPEMLGLQKPLFPTSHFLHLWVCNMSSHYFQAKNSQLTNERLVSNQADDPHPSATQQQQQQHLKAISVLKDEVDRCIFAGLDVARAFEPRLQHGSNHTCLTSDQVLAIQALRHCENRDISAWLHLARAPSKSCEHCKLIEG